MNDAVRPKEIRPANAQHDHANAHKDGQGKKPGSPRRRRKLDKRRFTHDPLSLGDWVSEPTGETGLIKGFGVLDLSAKSRKLLVETLCLKVGGVVHLGFEFLQNCVIAVCNRLLEHESRACARPEPDIGIIFLKPRAPLGRIGREGSAKRLVIRLSAFHAHLLHLIVSGDTRIEVAHKRHGKCQNEKPEDDVAHQRAQHAAAGDGQMLARAHGRLNKKTQEGDSRQAENHQGEAFPGKEWE